MHTILLSLLLAAPAVAAAADTDLASLLTEATPCGAPEFDAWSREHGLVGAHGPEEREQRIGLFCRTRDTVAAHNRRFQRGETTFWMRLNRFAAHTSEEWNTMMGVLPTKSEPVDSTLQDRREQKNTNPTNTDADNVTAVDWRKHGRVSSVKNQGQCGSCWAFSAIGAIEGAVSIAEDFTWNTSDVNEGYSVDQCLMCTPGAMECQGGWPWLCFEHIIQNGGIDSERDWPYLSETCDRAKEKFERVAAISSFSNISDGDEAGLRAALAKQPVSVGVRANCDAFHNYGGGVLDEDCGGGEQQIDHAILAVGFDSAAKTPYYIVKNSWGSDWGEDGYVRMKMGDNLDCIACKATYPTASKQQPPKPQPEIACPAGTFDPTLKAPPSCPKGSTCCCSRDYFWKKGQCKETACCLEGETCMNGGAFGKHGCYKNGTLVA